jgi:hypothetical protein
VLDYIFTNFRLLDLTKNFRTNRNKGFLREVGFLCLLKVDRYQYLDVDSTGEITCLSPSHYVPEYPVEPGIEKLPQKISSKRVFTPATLGKEVLLAAILPEEPTFDWLTETKCQVLDAVQLGELLNYIKTSKKPVDLIKSSVTILPA